MRERVKKHWTVRDVMALGPCYTRKEVKRLYKGRRALTLREILALRIPIADRKWFVYRVVYLALTDSQQDEFYNRGGWWASDFEVVRIVRRIITTKKAGR